MMVKSKTSEIYREQLAETTSTVRWPSQEMKSK